MDRMQTKAMYFYGAFVTDKLEMLYLTDLQQYEAFIKDARLRFSAI